MQKYNLKFKTDLRERCFQFNLEIIDFINTLPNKKVVWIISDQLLRSGLSVGANLIEAIAASSRLDFKRYHEVALKKR